MSRGTRAIPAFVAFVLALPAAAPASAVTGSIVCESKGYEYCNVDTQGLVRMVREVPAGNLCRQGISWIFDPQGIVVDTSCRAEFEIGRGAGSSGGNNDAAIAAGILGALVLGDIDIGGHYNFRRS